MLPRGKALEKKAYEIFLIFWFVLDFLIDFFYFFDFFLDFFNKLYVIIFSALPLGCYSPFWIRLW